MNNNEKLIKSILESIVVISIMSLYIVYGIEFLPLLMLLIPLPFVVLGVRNGIKYNIISIIVTSTIIQLILGSTSGASMVLIFAPLSIAINYNLIKRKSNTENILISTGAFFLSFLVLIGLGETLSDFNLTGQIKELLSQVLNLQVDMFKEMGMTSSEIHRVTDALEAEYKTFIIRIPSFLMIISFLISFININFSSLVLRKMNYGFIPVQRFHKFKLPNNIMPGVGIMFIFAFLIKYLGLGYHEALLLNLSFLVGFVFIIQGLAVLDHYLIKFRIKLFFRLIILAINIIFIPMGSLIFFVGAFDSIFDLRKIRRKKS